MSPPNLNGEPELREQRHSLGRRDTDGWLMNSKSVSLLVGLFTLLALFLTPILYVRDMAGTVRSMAGAVSEMKGLQTADQGRLDGIILELTRIQARSDIRAELLADHEERLRRLEGR